MNIMSGTELKVLRLALGLSVQDVSDIMYVSRMSIYNIEDERILKKSSLRYYTMTLKEIISERQLSDEELKKRTDMIEQLMECGLYNRFYSK